MSEVRSRLNEISGLEGAALTGEITAESGTLQTEYAELEVRHRAAITAAPNPQEVVTKTGDPEQREKLELRSKTGLADFLRAAAGGSAVTGAAAEYAAACGVPTVGHLPMALFGQRAPMPETRAITAAPAVDGPLQPTIPFVFERSATAIIGAKLRMKASAYIEGSCGWNW